MHDCLEPFDKVTTILSGDYPTQSMAYFALQTIRENVQEKHHPSSYHAIIDKSLDYQSRYYLDDFLPDIQKLGMKVRNTFQHFFLVASFGKIMPVHLT